MSDTKTDRLRRGLVLIAIGLLIAGIDLWLYVSPPEKDTISEVTLSWAGQHPIGVLMLGIILGHLFWPQRANK